MECLKQERMKVKHLEKELRTVKVTRDSVTQRSRDLIGKV